MFMLHHDCVDILVEIHLHDYIFHAPLCSVIFLFERMRVPATTVELNFTVC
jgi:hypothetical protein